MPGHNVVEALLANKEKVKPEEWITLLKTELRSPELLETPLACELKTLKGKCFSEVAKFFSIRFGVEIRSPAELIIALWIYTDRQKGITLKNPALTFTEMLGGQSLKEAIEKARLLMKGYPIC